MSKLTVENGITSLVLRIFVQDTSLTNGGGKTGLDHTSSGMQLSLIADNESSATVYTVAASNLETITTIGTFAAPTSGKARFKAVDETNLAGIYELHIANARWAVSGARSVQGMLFGASGAAPCPFEIQLHPVPSNLTHAGGTAVTASGGRPEVNTTHWGGTAVADARVKLAATQPDYAPLTSLPAITPGWLTAAGIDAGALNGKGDWSTADALTTAVSTISSLISALNNLSAKANWFGNLLLEVPDSGTRAYLFELVVRDDEDKLTNLDASPTIALVNAAGTDRSALITTGIANPATGRYTLTITIATDTVNESLKLTATGAISGETRYAVITPQVVDYDTATLINSIYNRLGAPAGASIAADIATRLASASYTAPDNAGIAAAKAVTDKVDTAMELDGAVYRFTANALEQAPAGGGGGGGDATAANQTTIINHLTDIKGAGWSSSTDTLEKIRDAITAALDSVIASVGVTPGALTGWPETMSVGDSYTDDCSRSIHLLIRDSSDDPITSIGSHAFTDADFTATVILSQGAQRGRVLGTGTWVPGGGGEGYLNVQIPAKESRRAAEGTATVQVLFRWTVSGDQYTLPAATTRWVAQL